MSVQIITSRHTVNRLSDFQLDMVLEKDGVLYMPASFVMAFYVGEWSCEDAYVASRLDGQTTNCEISGSVISVYFNSPGFTCGQLKCRVFDSVDNAAFTDGTLDTCTPLTLPVEIVATAGDSEVISLYTDGYQPPATGIPKGDLEQSVQDTLDSVANKVDKEAGKGLSSNDYTDADKEKLGDLPTKAELDESLDNAGKVKSVSVNGTNHTPNSSGVVDLGTIQGTKGDKGEKGDTVVIDPEGLEQFEIANDLDTSDPTQGLSARQGKILKQAISTVQANLQAVVDALANMAFTSAKPTMSQIDWTGGTFYATIVKNLTGCTATDNTNNGQIVEGQTLTMQLTADSGFTLTGATISVTNSKGQAVSYTLNGSTLTVANVTGTITVSVVAVGVFSVSLGSGSINVAFASGTSTEATSGSSWTGTIEAASGYKLPASIRVMMGGNAVTPTYNSTSGEITIANVTGDIVITAVAEKVGMINIQYNTDKWRKTPAVTQVSEGVQSSITIEPMDTFILAEVKYSVDGGQEQTATIVDNATTFNVTANTSVVINTKTVMDVRLGQRLSYQDAISSALLHAGNTGQGGLIIYSFVPISPLQQNWEIVYSHGITNANPGNNTAMCFYSPDKTIKDGWAAQTNGSRSVVASSVVSGSAFVRAGFRYTDAVYNEDTGVWTNPDGTTNSKESINAYGNRSLTINNVVVISEADIVAAIEFREQNPIE